jgi:uncharacterized protein (DUF924 family)
VIGDPERREIRALLDFWFGAGTGEADQPRDIWWESSPEFDAALRSRFLALHGRAERGELGSWLAEPEGALALVILLDQLSRNLYRGTPRAYASDVLARTAAEHALAAGFDARLPAVRRRFLYMPLMHSEQLADQQRCVALFATVTEPSDAEQALASAQRHAAIIARFGRFPHRNEVLGRETSSAEEAFLREPNSSF